MQRYYLNEVVFLLDFHNMKNIVMYNINQLISKDGN